jgi:hypothetical protein
MRKVDLTAVCDLFWWHVAGLVTMLRLYDVALLLPCGSRMRLFLALFSAYFMPTSLIKANSFLELGMRTLVSACEAIEVGETSLISSTASTTPQLVVLQHRLQ